MVPLHSAAIAGREAVTERLIVVRRHELNVDLQTNHGFTGLLEILLVENR